MKREAFLKKILVGILIISSSLLGEGPESFSKTLHSASAKSPQKAILYSAALPGAGQWYADSKLAAAIFATLEIAAISGMLSFQDRGNTMVSDYESFADGHWDVFRWLQGYYAENATEETHNVYILLNSRRYAFKEFTETYKYLPDPEDNSYDIVREYHFYENISKYKQFKQGWDDYEQYKNDPDYANSIKRSSPNQETYAQMRYDANIFLKRSGYFATAILFNHVVAAMDAGLRIHRRANGQDISFIPGAAPLISQSGMGAIIKLEIQW
ncbi:MAG TPA: hypothetical protein ENN84_04890 [Candidatus Marinimicrobia bacterium]|nr:hypothetical protein [Candidatus Neomarinimicrobiota bacterium]